MTASGKYLFNDYEVSYASLDIPLWLFFLALSVFVLFIILRVFDRKKRVLDKLSYQKSFEKLSGYQEFVDSNKNFSKESFLNFTRTIFSELYDALNTLDFRSIERKVSFGMLQRIKYKIRSMEILGETGRYSNISLKSADIRKIKNGKKYHILTVAMQINQNSKENNSQGAQGNYTEYWSFIKRKDNYGFADRCPSCGENIDTANGKQCKNCNYIYKNYDFDWALYDIKQSDDFIINTRTKFKTENLNERLDELYCNNKDFSYYVVIDKVIGIYLMMKYAVLDQNPKQAGAFLSPRALTKIKAHFWDEKILYTNLDINDITILGCRKEAGNNILIFALQASFNRMMKENDDSYAKIDISSRTATEIIFLERASEFHASNGSIYDNICPACNNKISTEQGSKCPSCEVALNDPAHDWILTDIMGLNEYRSYYMKYISDFNYKVSPELLDSVFSVMDYALNNVMLMIAIDGVFDDKEREFCEYIAKKWNYDVEKLEHMFELAKAGKLVIRMPEDAEKRRDIYELMVKAAKYDGDINQQEKILLDEVKTEYLSE